MAIVTIENGESGESIRTKLNTLIEAVNTIIAAKEFGQSAVEGFAEDIDEIKSQITTIAAKNSLIVQRALTGTLDGENKVFTTPEAFVSGSTRVYRNGQKLTLDKDYVENEDQQGITFVYAPATEETLSIEYVPYEE